MYLKMEIGSRRMLRDENGDYAGYKEEYSDADIKLMRRFGVTPEEREVLYGKGEA